MAHILSIPAAAPAAPSVEVPAAVPVDRANYQNIQTNPRQFGAQIGVGEEEFGAGALAAGKLFGQVAADQAINNWESESNKLLFGDPANPNDHGFYGLHGQEALDAMPGIQERLLGLRKSIGGTLSSLDQQILFDRGTSGQQFRLLQEMGRHYDQQAQVWANRVNDDTVANRVQSITSRPDDDENFDHSTADIMSAKTKIVQSQGGANNPEMVQHALTTGRQVAVAARIEGWLANGQAGKAAQFFRDNGDILKGPLGDSLKAKLDHAEATALGNTLVQRATGAAATAPRTPAGIGGAVAQRVAQEARQQNVDTGLALTTAHLESSMGQNLGTRGNIFQLGSREWDSVGGGNMADAGTQVRNGVAFLGRTKEQMQEALGRRPSPAEVYLGHQQGVSGATALLNAPPGTPAGSVVPPENIRANGGDPNAPASQFVAHWENQYNRTAASYGGAAGGGKFDMAAGDSIGVGHIRAAGLGGVAVSDVRSPDAALADAAGGRNPQQALDFVQTHPERFAGKTVLWSSGLMNAGANPAAALPIVAQQLDALKAAGATPVLAGVDTGRFAPYNAELEKIAAEHGVPFAGPLPTNNVHPGPQGYRDYAANAAKLIQRPQGADTITGQPAPAVAATPANAPAMPPGPPAPGVADVAAMQAANAREHAAAVANLFADPDAQANHAAMAAAEHQINLRYQSRELALSGQMKALTETRNATLDGYTKRMMKSIIAGVPDVGVLQEATNDPNLDAASRENLLRLYQSAAKQNDQTKYSPKFWEVYSRVTAPSTDPNKIRDPSEFFALANPKPDGTQDLTLMEVDKLAEELKKQKELGPGGEAIAKRKEELLRAVKPLIDKSNPLMGKIDQSGPLQLYSFGFALDQKIDEYRAAGKDPNNLFNPASPDYMGRAETLAPYQKPLQQSLKDRVQGLTSGTAPLPASAPVSAPPVVANPALQRRPGETPAEFLQRVRPGMMPAPASAPAAEAPVR